MSTSQRPSKSYPDHPFVKLPESERQVLAQAESGVAQGNGALKAKRPSITAAATSRSATQTLRQWIVSVSRSAPFSRPARAEAALRSRSSSLADLIELEKGLLEGSSGIQLVLQADGNLAEVPIADYNKQFIAARQAREESSGGDPGPRDAAGEEHSGAMPHKDGSGDAPQRLPANQEASRPQTEAGHAERLPQAQVPASPPAPASRPSFGSRFLAAAHRLLHRGTEARREEARVKVRRLLDILARGPKGATPGAARAEVQHASVRVRALLEPLVTKALPRKDAKSSFVRHEAYGNQFNVHLAEALAALGEHQLRAIHARLSDTGSMALPPDSHTDMIHAAVKARLERLALGAATAGLTPLEQTREGVAQQYLQMTSRAASLFPPPNGRTGERAVLSALRHMLSGERPDLFATSQDMQRFLDLLPARDLAALHAASKDEGRHRDAAAADLSRRLGETVRRRGAEALTAFEDTLAALGDAIDLCGGSPAHLDDASACADLLIRIGTAHSDWVVLRRPKEADAQAQSLRLRQSLKKAAFDLDAVDDVRLAQLHTILSTHHASSKARHAVVEMRNRRYAKLLAEGDQNELVRSVIASAAAWTDAQARGVLGRKALRQLRKDLQQGLRHLAGTAFDGIDEPQLTQLRTALDQAGFHDGGIESAIQARLGAIERARALSKQRQILPIQMYRLASTDRFRTAASALRAAIKAPEAFPVAQSFAAIESIVSDELSRTVAKGTSPDPDLKREAVLEALSATVPLTMLSASELAMLLVHLPGDMVNAIADQDVRTGKDKQNIERSSIVSAARAVREAAAVAEFGTRSLPQDPAMLLAHATDAAGHWKKFGELAAQRGGLQAVWAALKSRAQSNLGLLKNTQLAALHAALRVPGVDSEGGYWIAEEKQRRLAKLQKDVEVDVQFALVTLADDPAQALGVLREMAWNARKVLGEFGLGESAHRDMVTSAVKAWRPEDVRGAYGLSIALRKAYDLSVALGFVALKEKDPSLHAAITTCSLDLRTMVESAPVTLPSFPAITADMVVSASALADVETVFG